jgi:hypothetical protein
MTYCDKNPRRTSILSGYAWVLETLNTPDESHRMFRMNERLFIKLHDLLVSDYGLKSSIHMSSLEPLTIFLCICGQNRSNILVQNTFLCIWNLLGSQAPCMTQVCYSMSLNMILVPSDILLMVYISFGSICCICISYLFLHLPIFIYLEKYYMVDMGYPNSFGYLAPYKGQRYHVPDWRRGAAPSGEQETFNYFHSSIRNVVERAFGVWKMKWRILLKMLSYPMSKQKMIVPATMCLHNFIRENHALDRHFCRCDRDPDYMSTIPHKYARHAPPQNASDDSTSSTNDISIDRIRDNLAAAILQSRL